MTSTEESQSPSMSQATPPLYSLPEVARLVSKLHSMELLTVDLVAVEAFLEYDDPHEDDPDGERELHCETLKLLKHALQRASEVEATDEAVVAAAPTESSHVEESGEVEYTYLPFVREDTSENGDDIASDEKTEADAEEVEQEEKKEADVVQLEEEEDEKEKVVASDSIYEELYPYKKIIPKKQLPGMFPNMEDFTGGFALLGKGNFGVTFRSTLKGVPVVLKVSLEKGEKANRADYHEWSVNERLKRHPNVLQIIGLCPSFKHPSFPDIGTTAIISPLQENGTLGSFLQKTNCDRSSEWEMANLAFGMIKGIRSLHEQGVIHRDIALRNFLVDKDGRVVLCDFGLTQFLPEGKTQLKNLDKGELLPVRWLAPENLGGVFTKQSDMWMYGQTLLELVTGKAPWPDHSTASLVQAMRSETLELPDLANLPSIIAEIIRDCCELEATKRPSAEEVSERLARWQFRELDTHRENNGDTEFHTQARAGKSIYFIKRQMVKRGAKGVRMHLHRQEHKIPAQRGEMINATNDFGETPLMVAKNERTMEVLLWHRNIPITNEEPSTCLQYTYNIDVAYAVFKFVENHNLGSLNLLSKVGLEKFLSDFEKPQYKGRTPIHAAAHSGSLRMLKLLLSFNVFDVTKADVSGQSAIHVAASRGHHEIVKQMLSASHTSHEVPTEVRAVENQHAKAVVDVNMQDKNGRTALHLAAVTGTVETVRALVEHVDTKIDIPDDNGQMPVVYMLAASSSDEKLLSAPNSVEKVRLLVKVGCNLNSKDTQNYTALHYAAKRGLDEILSVLLSHEGVDANAQTKHGFTPLHLAALGAQLGVVETLLHQADIMYNACDRWNNTPLHLAAEDGSEFVIDALASISAVAVNALNKRSGSALHVASAKGHTKAVERLLARKDVEVNIRDSQDRTPLDLAAKNGQTKTIKALLNHLDIDVDAKDNDGTTALHLAAEEGQVDAVDILMSHGAQINEFSGGKLSVHDSALHRAAESGHLHVVSLLLSKFKVNPNIRNGYGEIPLYIAFRARHEDVAVLLLKLGADGNARDFLGRTALHHTAWHGLTDMVDLMITTYNLQANVRSNSGKTALHSAAQGCKIGTVDLLLSKFGLEINACDNDGCTALHYAAEAQLPRNEEVVELLVTKFKAHVNLPDKHGRTAIHYAAQRHITSALGVLLSNNDVDPNIEDAEGQTPLHLAAQNLRVGAARALFSNSKVRVRAQDNVGRTALHLAAASDKNIRQIVFFDRYELKGVHAAVVEEFLSHSNVDVNARDHQGRTPLHACATTGLPYVMKVFLSKRSVEYNAQDKNGQTALHICAEKGHLECVEAMLSVKEVDRGIRDRLGNSPLDLAKKGEFTAVVQLFEQQH